MHFFWCLPRGIACALLFCFFISCNGSSDGGGESLDRSLAGGDTTSDDRTALAFENPASNLSAEELDRHLEGDANFGAVFVSPPATFNAGLGPLFNNSSCEGCHTKNGRGQPIFGTGPRGSQAVLRLSSSMGAPELPGGPAAVSGLGTQLQDHAIFGTSPEGVVDIQYEFTSGVYADGTPYELRKPKLQVTLKNGAILPSSVMTSFRVPPPVFGLGLLEAIPEDEILAHADPEDANGDGISGRPNYVWDIIAQIRALGRFGRKANQPHLLQQAAGAYFNDMGVTNPFVHGGAEQTDIDQNIVRSVEFYVQTIAVPRASRLDDAEVKRGERNFKEIGCVGCHIPSFQTRTHPLHALENQRIFPYTDMLLHDMGEGLTDGRPDFEASANEWRTSPLWGIGITATILSNTATYLHDGRARTLEEAILWHGGEAERAREAFLAMSKDQRDAIITFLESL